METCIGNTWTQQERGHVHVQDMVPLSHIVSLISKRESGVYIRRDRNHSITDSALGKSIWTTLSARH
jgi:hypothetical protein